MINKNKLIKILSFTTLSIFIIVTINSLLDGKYFDAIGYFYMGFSLFVFPQLFKKE
jgi:hypothetical protein